MGAKRVREKGRSYELKIAHLLSKRFKTNFRRVPNSGAWNKTTHPGDIYCEKYFALSVECKNQVTINLRDWIEQSLEDCRQSGKDPCVVFHINKCKGLPKGGDYICLRLDDYYFYTNCEQTFVFHDSEKRWRVSEWVKKESIVIDYNSEYYAVFPFEEFIKEVIVKKVTRKIWHALKPCLIS